MFAYIKYQPFFMTFNEQEMENFKEFAFGSSQIMFISRQISLNTYRDSNLIKSTNRKN
jgi:hypothetical protein